MSSETTIEAKPITWQANVGQSGTIHAKRMAGRFRAIKWLTSSIWLIFFLGPYLRWEGQQALLIDIPNRQFHLYGITVHPHDIWVLTFVLIFFAMLLVVATVLAGRVFCGYFCFQTVWTDVYTWIEEKFEGQPRARHELDKAPMSANKFIRKGGKHTVWMAIAILTGVSFAAWFTDAYQLWADYFALEAHISAWIVLGMFTAGTYLLAGFMREQVCFWLCPYARIQGVLYDHNSVLPTYDYRRGEPRGKREQSMARGDKGDCVDCDQCLVVCPTGIDIRDGQQIGCITCGLCIDACDSVMSKIDRPSGLIRYTSLNEMRGQKGKSLIQRPTVLVSLAMIFSCVAFTAYGLSTITPAELGVEPQRQPLFVKMSDGSIQNSYQVRVFNKSDQVREYSIAINGLNMRLPEGSTQTITTQPGQMASVDMFVRSPYDQLSQQHTPIEFILTNTQDPNEEMRYTSQFNAPVN